MLGLEGERELMGVGPGIDDRWTHRHPWRDHGRWDHRRDGAHGGQSGGDL